MSGRLLSGVSSLLAQGRRPEELSRSGRVRKSAVSIAIATVTGLYAASGWMFARSVLELDRVDSALVSASVAMVIAGVELISVAGPSSWRNRLARLVIGLSAACLPAMTLELRIAEKDVEAMLLSERLAIVKRAHNDERAQIAETVDRRYAAWLDHVQKSQGEARNKTDPGPGPIYRAFAADAAKFFNDYETARKTKDEREAEMKSEIEALERSSGELLRKAGPLIRMKALISVAQQDRLVAGIWVWFMVLVLGLDLLVLGVVSTFPDVEGDLQSRRVARQAAAMRKALERRFARLESGRLGGRP